MFGMPRFQEQTSKDLGLAGKVSSIPQAYGDFISRNPEGVKKAFGDQYESMLQAIGAPLMQAAIPVMKGITDMFTSIGSFANANPDAIRQIGMGFAGLSVSLMGAGGLALLAALGPAGWMTLGVGALASAMIAFPNKWMAVVEAINGFMNAISDSLKKMLTGLLDWAKSFIPAWARKMSYEGGGFGGGGGITKAAWSGGGGNAAGALSTGERAQYASMIRQYGGSDANSLLKIYGTEGAGGYVGDHGSSFGPFQLHYGGMAGGGNRFGGMGDIFTRETGLDARDPKTVPAQIEWMKKWGQTQRLVERYLAWPSWAWRLTRLGRIIRTNSTRASYLS
jgi:hypothetical protein